MLYLFSLLLLIVADVASSQSLTWKTLSLPKANDRYNDVWFVDPMTGWAIIPSDGFKEDGMIYKTTDGGATWEMQFKSYKHLRSVCFLDPLVGFVGFLFDGTSSPLLKTTDGGETWNTVEITGSMPSGICGMMRVNDSTIVGTGQVQSPAHFIRTTDRGLTWTSVALSDNERDWAIDCYFWSSDSGIVAGGKMGELGMITSHIWQTTDGGEHWTDAYSGPVQNPQQGEWCWKISFPTPDVGYIAFEQNRGPSRYLKTTDRGVTWERHEIPNATIHLQGCGFITETHGWMGGRGNGAYVTTDGGSTWSTTPDIKFINRLRFFGDSIGYAAGLQVYKLSKETSDVEVSAMPDVAISYDARRASLNVMSGSRSTLSISDILGRVVMGSEIEEDMQQVDVSRLPSGVYVAQLSDGRSLKFSR